MINRATSTRGVETLRPHLLATNAVFVIGYLLFGFGFINIHKVHF